MLPSAPDMAQFKQGVRSVAGKLSVFANGVMTSIQVSAVELVPSGAGWGILGMRWHPLGNSWAAELVELSHVFAAHYLGVIKAGS